MKYLLIILLLAGCNGAQTELVEDRSYNERLESSDAAYIYGNSGSFVVSNNEEYPVKVDMNLNGEHFFSSNAGILSRIAIQAYGDESADLSIFDIFNFVVKNSNHDSPISANYWAHTPTLYFNSVGFGLCDDSASVFSILAREAGFDARVWGLGGHVVAEVLIDGKWGMFDPDYGVFFTGANGKVRSVESLELDVDAFSMPHGSSEGVELFNKNIEIYERIFTTAGNNATSTWYNLTINDQADSFTMPGFSRIEFPYSFSVQPKKFNNESTEKHTNLKLTVPSGFTGQVSNDLLIHAITGEGVVVVDGKEIRLNQSEPFIIDMSKALIANVDIAESYSEIEIIYLVNHNRFYLSGGLNTFNAKSNDNITVHSEYK